LPASFAGASTASFDHATTAFLLERNHGNLLLGISGDFYEKPGFSPVFFAPAAYLGPFLSEKFRVFVEIPRNPQQ
jgi:hypothetical protein